MTSFPASGNSVPNRCMNRALAASSSPFVGSSAIRSFAREHSAKAIVTRCAIPPDSSNGYRSITDFGSEKPACSNFSRATVARFPAGTAILARLSYRCFRTVRVGFRNSYPFCGIYTISFPSIARSCFSRKISFPHMNIFPPCLWTFGGNTPIKDCARIVFPEPVSPTNASVSPGPSRRTTSCTSTFCVRSNWAPITPQE